MLFSGNIISLLMVLIQYPFVYKKSMITILSTTEGNFGAGKI